MRIASLPFRALLVAGVALVPSALVLWSAAAADEAPKPAAKPAVVDNPGQFKQHRFRTWRRGRVVDAGRPRCPAAVARFGHIFERSTPAI